MTSSSIETAIREQRELLTGLLGRTMLDLAGQCARVFGEREAVESRLSGALSAIAYCKHLYLLDAAGVQFTDNITREGRDSDHFGRDRSDRPYMQGIVGCTDFKLSESYISRNKKRPMVTAVQVVRDDGGRHIGFLGADYDLRELPGTKGLYKESHAWRQIKGDPAIRDGLFSQQRVQSMMDTHLDDILALMNELMTQNGVFHGELHFASSRATVWLVDDPFAYRILGIDDLIHPDTCLAYPHRPYTSRAIVPPDEIALIFKMFRELRFADDTIYLRAGSLNVCNGMVSLNFSCDGTHYLSHDQFLSKGLELWIGGANG